MNYTFPQPALCCHSLPANNCALCRPKKPDADDLLRRIERLEWLMEHVCPDKSDDV